MTVFTIYKIYSPINPDLVYLGQTSKHYTTRFKQHKTDNSHIKKLLEIDTLDNLVCEPIYIAERTKKFIDSLEKQYIQF